MSSNTDVARCTALLVAPRLHPYRAPLLRRLELKIIDSQVVASLSLCPVGSSEHQRDELRVADVMALKAKLPPRQKASWVALLKSCHKELHGQPCYINGCPASGETFDTSMQRSIKHVWE